MSEKKYYYTDPETGDSIETTKEHYDTFNKYLQLKGNVGTVFVAGTGDWTERRDQELALWLRGEPTNFDILCGLPEDKAHPRFFTPKYPQK